ncbi:hypothetical protein ACHHYP_20821 [Achlya hypogyna]|uniref:Secreted protein n=1 Tax=Achlya hypogyna TaxID=1202772 RepID=A0A1V9ZEG2_ACHHY|nr:hypothetical protein ACHHYP_20821 [Achlya hypogyna]
MLWVVLPMLLAIAGLSQGCGDNAPPRPLDACNIVATTCPKDHVLAMYRGCPRCLHGVSCVLLDDSYQTRAPIFKHDITASISDEAARTVAYKDMLLAFVSICAVVAILFAAALRYRRGSGYYAVLGRQRIDLSTDENDNLNPFCKSLPDDDDEITLLKSPRGGLKSIIHFK